ncbi:hypothetical protein [Leekyejoonella antrihumi]|uniref:Uncharacterized protein n=1 Tax=Leekyejoonella antrihumi TaxID=1660198 RepID=A0A563DWH9_9MICO|nr:hypothetical protein [Leekyejoonella antrihumi]TWP34064.1 hypothetical protein FGL98_19035 [Leekyejoonella antrihumi]
MRLKRKQRLPAQIERYAGLEPGERTLAFAVDDNTGAHVIATTTHLVVATDEVTVLRRPWHDVDSGVWSSDHWTLTVSWVTRERPVQWTFKEQEMRIPETIHERVQASVVLSEALPLEGRRRSGRVVVRKDLATGELLTQTVLGRGTPADDPEVRAAVAYLTAYLREQVGL